MKTKNIVEVKEEMLKEYLSSQMLYVEFTSYIENKIKNILIENQIKYQSLNSRVKSYDSLEKKLTEEIINGVRKSIKNLNDLSGVRIIFYDEDELNRFNRIIHDEFNVQSYRPPENIMKYDGTNITISLKKNVNKFKGLLCEIQLTTVLSHAMNEFGHDIIYKDIDELQAKDSIEYNKIIEEFEKAREDALKIVSKFEYISKRVHSIKNGAQNIEIILGPDFGEKLDGVKSLNELENIINKMIEVIPMVNNDAEKYKKIYDSGIIKLIVKKFSELPVETAMFLNYDTYKYKYDKLLEFLKSYKYLWLGDFHIIITNLCEIASRNNLLGEFDKFIEKLLISDKIDSGKGYANYNIHQMAYQLIINKKIDEHIMIKMAEYFCDIRYDYCEEISMNKFAIANKQVNPGEIYKKNIYEVIEEILDIFLDSHSEEALHAIININRGLEINANIFDRNTIYEFFYENYNAIDIYSKNELYESVKFMKKSKFRDSKFYKLFEKDKIQKLYALLFNFQIDEELGNNYDEREKNRSNSLEQYIKTMKKSNISEIITILDIMDDNRIKNSNIYNAGKFLFDIGKGKYGEEILKQKWNEYVFLGVVKSNENYEYEIDNEFKSYKIINAMRQIGIINLDVIERLIVFSEKNSNENIEIEILKLISSNIDLAINKKYKQYLLNKIKKYNKSEQGVMEEVFFSPHVEKTILEKYKENEIEILVENFRYSEFKMLDEYLLSDLFEKYPNRLRQLIRQKLRDNPNFNLPNSYAYSNLTYCDNYKEERYNNLILCMDLLIENKYYQISNYIRYLIGEYNDELGMIYYNT